MLTVEDVFQRTDQLEPLTDAGGLKAITVVGLLPRVLTNTASVDEHRAALVCGLGRPVQKSGLLATGIGSSFCPKGLKLSPSAQRDSIIPPGDCALRARIWRCTGWMKDAGSSMVTCASKVLPPSIR